VALDGIVSDDGQPAGATVSTAWSVQSGPAGATFADVNAVDTTVTFASDGTYVLELTGDDTALQSSDTVTIIVEVASALTSIGVTPSDAALVFGGTQTFTANGTDQYGDPIAVNATWTATGGTIDAGGNYTAGSIIGPFTVTATDGSVSGTANVTISEPPLTANAGGPYAGAEQSAIALDGSASFDPDNDIVSYEWDLDNDGAFDDASGVNATYSAGTPGVFTVGLLVTNGSGATDSDTTTVTVNNIAPTADASAGAPYSGDQGADIVLDGSASSDPSGVITLYEWDLDNDTVFDDATGVNATFNSAAPGNFTVGLRVTDGNGGTGTTTVGVTVNDIAPSAPVSVSASGDDGQVSLDWADNPEPDLAAAPYRVYRSEVQGVLGTELAASPFSTSDHIDSTVVNGTTYYYVVTAEDANSNVSANSAEVATTPNGPVHAYWKLDENAGITTADTVAPDDGSGTINGATWTTGVSGSALDFNGIGDYIVIDNTPQLHITGKAISMHAWVFPRGGAVNNRQKIISKYNDRGIRDTFAMMIQDYRVRFRLDDELMTSSHIVTLNEWVHVAMVYDGTDMRIYFNGVLDAETPVIKSDPIDASTRAVHLGRREGEGQFFDGIIDEVQILNSVLIPGLATPPARGAGLFFEDITAAAGIVSPILGGHGVMFADANNDSRPDFYMTNNRENNSDRPDFFHENTNGAVFAQAQSELRIDDTDGGSHGAVWADLDNDGDYDLVNGTTWDNADPNPGNPDSDNVYRNDVNTSGFFTEVTPPSIQAVEIETNGITAFDMMVISRLAATWAVCLARRSECWVSPIPITMETGTSISWQRTTLVTSLS
jgi:hypothetical protein